MWSYGTSWSNNAREVRFLVDVLPTMKHRKGENRADYGKYWKEHQCGLKRMV